MHNPLLTTVYFIHTVYQSYILCKMAILSPTYMIKGRNPSPIAAVKKNGKPSGHPFLTATDMEKGHPRLAIICDTPCIDITTANNVPENKVLK